MKTCFNNVDMDAKDLYNDEHPIEDIVAVVQFQTCIACGATIESLNLVEITNEIEDKKVMTILHLEAVVNGETFKIVLHVFGDNELLTNILKYDTPESRNATMDYIRILLG